MINYEKIKEAGADNIHIAYLATCRRLGWSVKDENKMPYSELSNDSKELDRASFEAAIQTLQAFGLINEDKLQQLTQPEQKYKEGDIVWTYGMTIQDWKIDSIYYEPDRNDFRVNLSNPYGKASVMQSQLYPTRQFLIEAQIDYWQNLLNEEKPTSSCCSAHAGSTDECKDECQHESEKLYMYSEYCANPPVFECKKCGEFYR